MIGFKNTFLKIAKVILLIYIKTNQKTFGDGYQRIKYLLSGSRSRELVVIFSAFPDKNRKASYNMINTLWNVKINKLFILDDFGYEKRGSCYLGENGNFFIISHVIQLIEKVKMKNKILKVYCVGSSKGGYAALYYGLKVDADLIIAGAPQYLQGDYLSENEDHLKILQSVMGESSKKSINYLNEFLRNEIINHAGEHKPKLLIHYSKNEHTYGEHIVHLLCDLKKFKYEFEEDIESYSEHWEVAKYFPKLCINRLKKGDNV